MKIHNNVRIKTARYSMLRFRFKQKKEVKTMDIEKQITAKVRNARGVITPEKLAHSLKTDVQLVRQNLKNLEKTGQIKLVTWEGLIEMGK